MRFLLSVLTVLFIGVAAPVWAADAAPDASVEQAKAYVSNVAQQAVDTIDATHSGKLNNDQAKQKFRAILNSSFDIPTIAKFTLGRYWRTATADQQTEFTRLLKTVILNKYADRLLESSDNKFQVGEAGALNDRDYKVAMTVTPKGKPQVSFVWRLRKGGSGFKIIDLAVEGVSMSVTHRTDFANTIEREGGNVQALIDALKSKESEGSKS